MGSSPTGPTYPVTVLADSEITNLPPEDGGSAAWAVGYGIHPSTGNRSSLIEFGTANGGWAIVPSPDPAGRQGNLLIGAVQAFGSRNIWAAGTFDRKGGTRTLILHRTGRPGGRRSASGGGDAGTHTDLPG